MDTWPWETGESGPNGAAKAKPKASSGDVFTVLPHFDGSKRAAWPGFRDLVRGTVTEFIAMTLFVYFGCGAASSNAVKVSGEWDPASVTIIALQFGLAITVLAFATAHTSGGHINCAVTLALMVVGTCHPVRASWYFVAQILGSIAGAGLLALTTSGDAAARAVLDRSGALGSNGLQNSSVTELNAFVVEVVATALLCFVVLETAVNTKAVTTDGETMVRGNKQNLAPIAIGLAVFLAHVIAIPITGCSINPTRSFGPALVSNTWDNHWIWWAGPLTGSLLAALSWGAIKFLDDPPPKEAKASTASV